LFNTPTVSNIKTKKGIALINSLFRLEKQLNNALHQAGIYTMSVVIFGFEEAVDNFG